jgi:hypothetical protein
MWGRVGKRTCKVDRHVLLEKPAEPSPLNKEWSRVVIATLPTNYEMKLTYALFIKASN